MGGERKNMSGWWQLSLHWHREYVSSSKVSVYYRDTQSPPKLKQVSSELELDSHLKSGSLSEACVPLHVYSLLFFFSDYFRVSNASKLQVIHEHSGYLGPSAT